MSSLLPQNATKQEEDIEASIQRSSGINIDIDLLWSPLKSPAVALPWLAWAFSVDQWDYTWTEEEKRSIVANAYLLHRRKGTPAAVKSVVDIIFGQGEVLEHWDFDGDPYTFKILTEGKLQSDEDYKKLIRLVDSTKPARSHLVAVQIDSTGNQELKLGFYQMMGINYNVNPSVNSDLEVHNIRLGIYLHNGQEYGVGLTTRGAVSETNLIFASIAHLGSITDITIPDYVSDIKRRSFTDDFSEEFF